MSSPRNEESFPLLLLFLEEGKQSPRKKNNLFFEKSRYGRISEGAGKVLTQLPGHVSACFLTSSVLLIFFLVLLTVVVLGTLPTGSPKCLNLKPSNFTKIYLVHNDDEWHKNQFEAIEEIIKSYPNIPIELVIFGNSNVTGTSRPKRAVLNATELNINIGDKTIIKRLKPKPMKVQNITLNVLAGTDLKTFVKANPIINVTSQNKKAYFEGTPLYADWVNMNDDLQNFAARAAKLWEFGGISFKLPSFDDSIRSKPRIHVKNHARFFNMYEEEWTIDTLIKSNISSFMDLPFGVVNIDNEGLHMETKTACHAFFGEVLANLRRADINTTVQDVVKATLKTFCLNGSVNDEYCFNFFMH